MLEDSRENEWLSRVLGDMEVFRQWIAERDQRRKDTALQEAVKTAVRSAIDELMERFGSEQSEHEKFKITEELIKISDRFGQEVLAAVLAKLKTVSPNSLEAMLLVSVLADIGLNDEKAVASMLELTKARGSIGRYARWALMNYFQDIPSMVIDGFLHLIETRKRVSEKVTEFVAEQLIFSRKAINAEEAQGVVDGVWELLDCGLSEKEMKCLAGVITEYAKPVYRASLEVGQDVDSDVLEPEMLENGERSAEVDRKIVGNTRKVIVGFFEKISSAEGNELLDLMRLNKIGLGCAILMSFVDEESLEALAKFVRKVPKIVKLVPEAGDYFYGIARDLRKFLREHGVEEFQRRQSGGRKSGDRFMHHQFIIMERQNELKGCRQLVQERKMQQVLRLF